MGVLVSKPSKPQKKKINVQTYLGTKFSKRKSSSSSKTDAVQPACAVNLEAPSIKEDKQITQESVAIVDEAISKAIETVKEAEINEAAEQVTNEAIENAVEKGQNEEVASVQENSLPTENVNPEPQEEEAADKKENYEPVNIEAIPTESSAENTLLSVESRQTEEIPNEDRPTNDEENPETYGNTEGDKSEGEQQVDDSKVHAEELTEQSEENTIAG